jgi:nitroreductase
MLVDTTSIDHVLTTTRAVRRRLDLERAVPIEVVLECLELATQAPIAGARQTWRWVVVNDPDQRAKLAEIYRTGGRSLLESGLERAEDAMGRQAYEGAMFLADNLHRVPVIVIPCIEGRLDAGGHSPTEYASLYGSILPAAWSFQLALRSRGLGSCWTVVHLEREKEVGELLGIPENYTQAALMPVAYTKGGDFRPASRVPIASITYLNHWGALT